MADLKLSGISKPKGYYLQNEGPLDVRTVVTEIAHLETLVNNRIAYPGMVVYVNSADNNRGLYVCESNKLNEGIWKPIATNTSPGDIEIPEVDLTGYATEQYVKDEIAKIDFPKTDLSDYALKTELFSKNYNDLTNKPTIPSIAGLATETYVNTAISNLSSSNHNHNDLYAPISHSHTYKPSFSKYISHGAGNPQAINFITVDYSTYTSSYAAYFKLDATSCHGNGVSYQFLEEIIIGVTTAGNISLAINKSCQQACGQVDGIERYFGDVFAVKDETNKKVYFYILGGQYCLSWYTDLTPIGSATTAGVTQHTSLTLYSSGDKIWAQGCGNTCHDYLPISGGNLTGALTVNGAGGIDTNGYVTSTWLKTTDATDLNKAASKVAVIDASGWIYYRTPAELMSDMGGVSTDTKNTAGASNKTSTKLFLVGATSQTDGIQTYSNSEIFINTSNEVEATGFYAKSDKRLKENIKEFIPAKSILELPVVEFDYINTGNHQIGCLAQDLQEICPEIVNTDENGYLSINESKIVYLLLDEVKKLKEETKWLKKELEELKK